MNPDLSPKSPAARPTFVRYGVLAFACSLAMITYLDRATIGVTQAIDAGGLGFRSVADLNWVLVAFSLAYALFEVPTGWLGDVFGPRKHPPPHRPLVVRVHRLDGHGRLPHRRFRAARRSPA